jgi:hypothetical protein
LQVGKACSYASGLHQVTAFFSELWPPYHSNRLESYYPSSSIAINKGTRPHVYREWLVLMGREQGNVYNCSVPWPCLFLSLTIVRMGGLS